MPVWMMILGAAFWIVVIWAAGQHHDAATQGEKKAWNFGIATLFLGGVLLLAIV